MNVTIWTDTQVLNSAIPCRVFAPRSDRPLPVVYLLHGLFDTEDDWWSGKGQLPGILAGVDVPPVLLVMPFCAVAKLPNTKQQQAPPLGDVLARFGNVEAAVLSEYGDRIDQQRNALLGISMGGKQALALVLTGRAQGFLALGVFSAMLQDPHKADLVNFVLGQANYPQDLASTLPLYFHYCGGGKIYFFKITKLHVMSWEGSYSRIRRANTIGGTGDRNLPSSFGV